MDSQAKKVLLVGECVLDIIQEIENFPKDDDDVRSTYGFWQRGGNASNNSTVLTHLGRKCELLTTFSDDKMFGFVIEDLKDRGIEIKNCHTYPNCNISLSTVLLCKSSGCRTIIHSNKNLPHVNFQIFDKCDLNEYFWVHFEARMVPDTIKMMLKIIEHNKNKPDDEKIKISLDLEKKRDENLLLIKYADVVFIGQDFAEFLGFHDKNAAINKFNEMMTTDERYKNENCLLICPWGVEGACAVDSSGQYYSSPCYPPPKIVDTLGAGDTFCAATLHFLMDDFKNVNFAIDQGCRIAGLKCGNYGYDCVKGYKH